MSSSEIQSFINKFHQLRRAGLTAHLDLETHAGKAWMGLRIVISPDQKLQKFRNPSYFRRQERRKAAAKATEASKKPSDSDAIAEEAFAKEVDDPEGSAEEALATDNVSESNAEEAADSIETAEQADIPERDAEEAENAINRSTAEKTIISDSNLVDDITKDVKQADNSKSENVFHTKRKIVKYTNDGEWVDYCPSPI